MQGKVELLVGQRIGVRENALSFLLNAQTSLAIARDFPRACTGDFVPRANQSLQPPVLQPLSQLPTNSSVIQAWGHVPLFLQLAMSLDPGQWLHLYTQMHNMLLRFGLSVTELLINISRSHYRNTHYLITAIIMVELEQAKHWSLAKVFVHICAALRSFVQEAVGEA